MMLYYLGSDKKEGVYKFSMGAPSPNNFNPERLTPQIQSCGYERINYLLSMFAFFLDKSDSCSLFYIHCWNKLRYTKSAAQRTALKYIET